MPKTSYHFDVGNSSDGPLGLCARVLADSPEEALALLKAALPEEVEVDTDESRVEYINVYINDDYITVKDVGDEEDGEDEDDDSWDGEDEPDEEDEDA